MQPRQPLGPGLEALELLLRLREIFPPGGNPPGFPPWPAPITACPRCGEHRLARWGRFAGRQRFRCAACGRTSSTFTRTPIACSKKPHLWPAYAAAMAAPHTLRDISKALGIHLSTAFRWRHALLDGARARRDPRLTGEIQVDFQWIAFSEKGNRHLDRPPRRHGYRNRPAKERPSIPRIAVNLAIAEDDAVVWGITKRGIVEQRTLMEVVGPRLCAPALLLTGFRGSPRQGRLLPRGVRIEAVPRTPGRSRAWGWVKAFLGWLLPFRGVATKYLENYLSWFEGVGTGPPAVFVGALLTGVGPSRTNISREQSLT